MDDINDTGHELRPPNSMDNSGLWLTSMNSGCEIRTLDALNNSELDYYLKSALL